MDLSEYDEVRAALSEKHREGLRTRRIIPGLKSQFDLRLIQKTSPDQRVDCITWTLRQLISDFSRDELMQEGAFPYLHRKGFNEIDLVKPGVIAAYQDLSDGRFRHFGIVDQDSSRANSKFGYSGDVFNHPLYMVPLEWGDRIRFFER